MREPNSWSPSHAQNIAIFYTWGVAAMEASIDLVVATNSIRVPRLSIHMADFSLRLITSLARITPNDSGCIISSNNLIKYSLV